MTRIAILGGTFDPIHDGHLALGIHFSQMLHLDQLILMPAGQPWHKTGVSSAEHRLAMTRIAADGLALAGTQVQVGADEVDRHGDTYTVDTLSAWRQRIGPEASLSLLIGADQFVALDRWHDWLHLFDFAHVCVATRPGFDLAHASPAVMEQYERRGCTLDEIASRSHGGMLIDRHLELDISSTDIRERAQHALLENAEHCEHVPDPVWQYIRQYRLYGESPAAE